MPLSIELRDYGELTEALLASFERSELGDIVQALNVRKGNIGSEVLSDPEDFGKAVGYFSRRNQADDLIIQARAVNSGNPKLFAVARRYGLATQLPAEAPDLAALEAAIRPRNPFLDLRAWLTNLTALEGRICLVKAGTKTGTGFLIGLDTVMTNYHVMSQVIAGKAEARHARFIFDTGLRPPNGVAFRPADEWLVDASENDPRDGRNQQTPADVGPDKLDYAVVRLAGRPGEQPVGGDGPGADGRPRRGHIPLSDLPHDYATEPGMIILQHPGGGALKMAFDPDAYVTQNPRSTRVYYAANTDEGSSGSPCFDLNLNLIALHQAHIARLQLTREANSGVPIDAIYRLLEERGKLDAATGGA